MPRKFIPKAPRQCENCNRTDCEFSLSDFTGEKIARECKTYYDLFLELEQRSRLVQLVHDGEEYEPNLMGPAIVIGSLSAELSLKLLIFIEKGQFDYIHDLEKLFYNLPDNDLNELSTRLRTEVHLDDNSLRACIKQIAHNFEFWRYFFQADVGGITHFFPKFVHIVCDYALSGKYSFVKEDGSEIQF